MDSSVEIQNGNRVSWERTQRILVGEKVFLFLNISEEWSLVTRTGRMKVAINVKKSILELPHSQEEKE